MDSRRASHFWASEFWHVPRFISAPHCHNLASLTQQKFVFKIKILSGLCSLWRLQGKNSSLLPHSFLCIDAGKWIVPAVTGLKAQWEHRDSRRNKQEENPAAEHAKNWSYGMSEANPSIGGNLYWLEINMARRCQEEALVLLGKECETDM